MTGKGQAQGERPEDPSPRRGQSATSQKSQAEERNLEEQCLTQRWEPGALEHNCPQRALENRALPSLQRETSQREDDLRLQ